MSLLSSPPMISKKIASSGVRRTEEGVRYVQGQVIASGGAGAVYTGWDQQLRRHVAIKRFNPTSSSSQQEREEFMREVRHLASVSHPNILSIHDICTDQAGPYMVLEYLPGRNLREIVQVQPLNEAQFITVTYQILSALAFTHSRGLVHNDIKPENIIVWEDGAGRWHIKLLDFGCARSKGELPTDAQGHVLGSIYYVSPEVVQSQPPDDRSDLYSLGLVLCYALTGRDPFSGETPLEIAQARLERGPISIAKYRNDLSAELQNWIYSLTRREARERPDSARAALESFDLVLPKKSWITKIFHGLVRS